MLPNFLYLWSIALISNPTEALEGIFWLALRKRVRGRNRILGAASSHPHFHRYWIDNVEPQSLRTPASSAGSSWSSPRLVILVIADAQSRWSSIMRSIESVEKTFGADVSVMVSLVSPTVWQEQPSGANPSRISDDTITNTIKSVMVGEQPDYILPIFAGDRFANNTPAAIEWAVSVNPQATIIYWDEDWMDRKGKRANPWFKPDWNLLQFYAQDYLTGSCMIRCSAINSLFDQPDFEEPLDIAGLLIQLVGSSPMDLPFHLDQIIVHRSTRQVGSDYAMRAQSLKKYMGDQVEISVASDNFLRLTWPIFGKAPSVSVIIPTRDRVDLLSMCIDGVEKIDYPGDLEIIVIDNDSSDPETHEYFAKIKKKNIKVLSFPGKFNFSSMNNYAASEAEGQYICFLNNDIEMLDGSWLTYMMGHAMRPSTGAVGAKLLYGDRTIQHAGIVVGIGGAAGHAHRNLPDLEGGYFHQPHVSRFVTAVTGACLLVERAKFDAVGGFDEEKFPVAFNDVDLCLKLDLAGWDNVYASEAVLIHHESKSRGDDMSSVNFARYKKELNNLQIKWKTTEYRDRYHNRNISKRSEIFYAEV